MKNSSFFRNLFFITIFALAAFGFLHLPQLAQAEDKTVLKIDTAQSSVKWLGKKLAGQHNGIVKLKSGAVTLSEGAIIGGNFVINMQTIENEDIESPKWRKKLEDHLKSEDFFNVSKFPEGVFSISNAKKGGEHSTLINGNLSIKGISLPVTLTASIIEDKGIYTAKGTATIDRTKWEIRYNSGKWFDPAILGDKLIYDDIEIEVNIVTLPS